MSTVPGENGRPERIRAFIAARFSRTGYLGLYLTIGLGLSLLSLWLFAAVAEDVVTREPLTLLDLRVANLLHQYSTPPLTTVARVVTLLGAPVWLALIGIVVAVLLYRGRRRLLLLGWIAALLGGDILDFSLKQLFHRPRPYFSDPIFSAQGWSFPSGHALESLITYGMLIFVILQIRPSAPRLALPLAATLLVIAIGITRLYLGVHYLSDVLAGYAAAAMWLAACISGVLVALRRPVVAA
ncbi:MAG: phosphatase PAP2 family protein [Gemmatimonadota bacterium]